MSTCPSVSSEALTMQLAALWNEKLWYHPSLGSCKSFFLFSLTSRFTYQYYSVYQLQPLAPIHDLGYPWYAFWTYFTFFHLKCWSFFSNLCSSQKKESNCSPSQNCGIAMELYCQRNKITLTQFKLIPLSEIESCIQMFFIKVNIVWCVIWEVENSEVCTLGSNPHVVEHICVTCLKINA